MLKPLRKKMVIKVTLWILLATFIIWGVGSVTMTARSYVGTIFNKGVTPQEYSRSYSAVSTRAKIQYGDNFSKIQKFLNLESQAWDRLILLYHAKKKKIKTNNKEVVEKIAQMPFFQSEGAFDQRAYNYIVQNIFGTTLREFEETVREDIIISRLIDSVEKDATVTEQEIEQAYRIKFEKADINYILINSDSFKDKVVYKDDELEAFYNSHKEQFRTQEKRNVYYIKIPFTEKEGKQEDKQKARQLAQEINDYLNLGEDFNELTKKYSLSVEETGPFSFGFAIPNVGLSYPFSIAAFSLSQERKNDVIEDSGVFYVIKLKEKIEPYLPGFEQAKEDVQAALMNSKSDELAKGSTQNYYEILNSKKDTLENLASQIKVDVSSAKDLTRESNVGDISAGMDFNNACFSVKEGEFAGPVKVKNGYAVIRLDKLKEPDKEKFQKEKEAFKNQLLEEKKQKIFGEWFSDLKAKANLKVNF